MRGRLPKEAVGSNAHDHDKDENRAHGTIRIITSFISLPVIRKQPHAREIETMRNMERVTLHKALIAKGERSQQGGMRSMFESRPRIERKAAALFLEKKAYTRVMNLKKNAALWSHRHFDCLPTRDD